MRGCPKLIIAVAILTAGCGKSADRGPATRNSATPSGPGLSSPSAEEFWGRWRLAVAAGDGESLWQMTCASHRRAITERTRGALGSMPESEWAKLESLTTVPIKELRAMSAEDLAKLTTVSLFKKLREQPGEIEKVEKSTLTGTEIDGGRAIVRFRPPDGREMTFVLVLEDNAWKADPESSAKIAGGVK